MKHYIFQKGLFSLVLILFIGRGIAQERKIQGVVTTFDSIPVSGASIILAGTKQEVLSDSMGNFAINNSGDDKLIVSARGFKRQKVKLTDLTKYVAVNLHLKPGMKSREYAIAYGHVSDADKIFAIANMNNEDEDFSRFQNMYDLIRGRFAGVRIQGKDIIIRGEGSFLGSNAALIVVDGVITDSSILDSIVPADVKDISILKDSSAAIYGSRGANGVVIIETRRGGDG